MGFEIHKSKDGEYYYLYRNVKNAEVQFTSETYASKGNAYRGVSDFVDDLGVVGQLTIQVAPEDKTDE